MIAVLARKLLRIALTLWVAATFVFITLRLSGDPVLAFAPPDLPDAILDLYRARLGLDRPLLEQYLGYLGSLVRGDFGYSFRTSGPALDLVLSRLPATLLLGAVALVVAVLVGMTLGILAAMHRNSWIDRVAMGFAVFGFSMPNFFFGILLILAFTLTLNWLPSAGSGDWRHLVMPAATLGLAASGAFARYTRSSLLEVLRQPYMRTAAAKGLGPLRQLLGHALPNAGLPLLTLLGLSVGQLIAGAVVTEQVFGYPGVGRLLVTSVSERDLAVVQLLVLMTALAMALANLLTDLGYALLDPRLRDRAT